MWFLLFKNFFISYIATSIWNMFRKYKRTIRLTIKIRERSNWMQSMELMFLQHIWWVNKFRWKFNCSWLPDIEETVKPTNDVPYACGSSSCFHCVSLWFNSHPKHLHSACSQYNHRITWDIVIYILCHKF